MSLLLRSRRAFFEENDPLLQSTNVPICDCCPYGYHIDLDFVRYCESLANAKQSKEELRRRSKRRSRKSMEFMLGLENTCDKRSIEKDVQTFPERHRGNYTNSLDKFHAERRPRSSSVPRFTYEIDRSVSPFGTTSSTCSSTRGAESDAIATYCRQRSNIVNGRFATRAFLQDALDDVYRDFESTLQRTSKQQKDNDIVKCVSSRVLLDRNNNNDKIINGDIGKKMHLYQPLHCFDACDSSVSGNKSPRRTRSHTLPFQQKLSPAEQQYECYVQATVAANAKIAVDELDEGAITLIATPPPPPPRRHTHVPNRNLMEISQEGISDKPVRSNTVLPVTTTLTYATQPVDSTAADAHMLYNIRQQMALSLNRMKDLEDQVKLIPDLQHQLTHLHKEKQRLEHLLQRKEDELHLTRETVRSSYSSSPAASPKPVQFTPQRISPISLESMGACMRGNMASSERVLKTILKRDVGTMCAQHTTRDVAVGTPHLQMVSSFTSPMEEDNVIEKIYTDGDLKAHIQTAISRYKEQHERSEQHDLKHWVSVGTQMYVPKTEMRDQSMQTVPEKAILKYAVGVTAKPSCRDSFIMCQPDLRSVGCSDDRITDEFCRKCAVSTHTVACGTGDQLLEKNKNLVNLKSLELIGRSNTFCVGERVNCNNKHKTVGTQCSAIALHTIGCQTILQNVNSVSTQNVPKMYAVSTQCQSFACTNQQTDTSDLIILTATKPFTEEVAPQQVPSVTNLLIPKTELRSHGTNTELLPRMVDAEVNTTNVKLSEFRSWGVNTDPSPNQVHIGTNTTSTEILAVRHTACNTEQIYKRDMGCGDDVVKSNISIACGENYCDSCKDAIKNFAKDITKNTPAPNLQSTHLSESKIPRPKHLTSPIPDRKPFKRQDTYTITSTTSATHSLDASSANKQILSSLGSKPQTDSSLHESATSEMWTIEPKSCHPSNNNKNNVTATCDLSHVKADDLVVKEETRVRISWSRDNSPAPPNSCISQVGMDDTITESKENVLNDVLNVKTSQLNTTNEEGETGGQLTSISLQKVGTNLVTDTEEVTNESLLSEAKYREKTMPAKEILESLKVLNDSLLKKFGAKSISSSSLKALKATIQKEWFRISSTEQANPQEVNDYLECFENYSVPMLEYCINMVDSNGNTAMHYAVSHGNFDVVSLLMDSKVCNVNQMNNAGYTCVMLVSLAKLKNSAHRTIVERLFQMADVNIRAKKHCQTALMLAVSHGNLDMVEMLIAAGADINLQDEDGSTALMCAAEHGRIDIVKHLLSQPSCDSLIQDIDGSTAFKIAWQAGNRDIGLLLYIHEQMLRTKVQFRSELPINQQRTNPNTFSPKLQKRQSSE